MTIRKKILIGFITCGVVLAGVAIFAIKNSAKFIESNALVDHTNKVISEFEQILVATINAESITRGYVITGENNFMESFPKNQREATDHLSIVKDLTLDNPSQQKNIEALESLVNKRFDILKECIEQRKKGFEQARIFVTSGAGKRIQDAIEKQLERSMEIENLLMKERKQNNDREASNFNIVFGVLLLVILVILLVVYNIISSNLKALKTAETESADKNWVLTGNTLLNEKISEAGSLNELANNTIGFLCTYLKANIGAVYLLNEKENTLSLNGQYAFSTEGNVKQSFKLNEGLIGQAAEEQKQIVLSDLQDEQIRVTSLVLNAKPKHLIITPFVFEGKTMGVIEIGSLKDFNEKEKELIAASMDSIAVSVNTAMNQDAQRELLARIQTQKDEIEISALELEQQINSLNKAAIVSITDANGIIIYANDNFCSISKYSREELLGKNHRILKSEKQPEGLFVGMWASIALGKTWKGEILNKAKDGSFYWVDTTITPFKEIDGTIEKHVSIRFDITDSKNQMIELGKLSEEREKRSAELVIVNKELIFQSDEKEKRAAELVIANKELAFQSDEKEKRSEELIIANKELAFQAEELQAQQEELRQMNEELEEQTQNLKQQQEELQMTNEELEEQTQSLEIKNKEVENAKNDIEKKTKQLEISSKYKSEFLANMSHELRTPLNSLLILSKDLSENKKKNLDKIQVESAEIIYRSGHDLLVLINEVLDLSKIEAGKMSLTIERVSLKFFLEDMVRNFKHSTEEKGLKLISKLDKEVPESMRTDSQRLNQVVKNLLSNAIKFTEKGSVSIHISKYSADKLAITVIDTGIGIIEEKQMAIFEAFQQADGGTSRKYGGTGLGLSISRELAKLLGAEIKVESKINEGATFTLIIPLEIREENEPVNTTIETETVANKPSVENNAQYLNYPTIEDDRNSITKKDKVVLVIEDDLKFAAILLNQANKKGFKCLSASTGEDGLVLVSKYKPQAIILDMDLPGINGHRVLLELKANPSVRHIPVHVISANERSLEPIKEGAVEYLMKPIEKTDLENAFTRIENFVNRKIKNLLIIEDSENSRKAMKILIGSGDVKCFEAANGKEAIDMYTKNHIDCIILDIGLPDISGFDLIRQLKEIKNNNIPPIIVYTGKELTREENNELQKYAKSIIIKGVKSEERLLDETALFLHRTISNLPESKQLIINSLYDKEAIFHSKKVLLVDDDSRNVFALTQILIELGIAVIKAENGKIALDMLATHPDVDLVLMDIMMPVMDGYEAMKKIRLQMKYRHLPVIALTAKAMKDDKQKCIDAGANDYITKPIDVERLLSLMRVWLSK